ncbi:MAG: metal ABC transporter ATP-binding protein [Candidatus Hydrogenedentes bacterium]|nr:metal ABC transporter ATP-binding protein [Candidatus Hydrogenedentota bacterium]
MNVPAVEAERVSVRFGDHDALRGVSFAVPEGAFVALIGPNGAGKTTLLNVVLGLQRADRGTVRVFGHAPHALSADALGYIPQVKTLDRTFPGRALELVVTGIRRAWPWRVSAAERDAALAAMQRTGAARVADRAIAKLSGGELQRVYLARALVRSPKLLVLDEPGAGMDIAGEAEMHHILEDYRRARGATVLMITHDWEGARAHATHVLLMDRGLAAFGAPAEVAREERLLQVFGYAGHKAATHGGPHDG